MPSYLGTTANVGTCSACSYWSVASESGSRVEYGGHVWHERLPTKCVLGRMDMVLGQLETVGRNWTLRASLQRGIIKAIVRFPSRVLRGLVLKPKAKIKLQPPSVRSKARDIRRLEWFMRLSSRWIVLMMITDNSSYTISSSYFFKTLLAGDICNWWRIYVNQSIFSFAF